MPAHDIRKNMKGICILTTVHKLCAIPLNLALAKTFANTVTGATHGNISVVTVNAIRAFAIALFLVVIQLWGQILIQRKILRALNCCKLNFLDEVLNNPPPRLLDATHGELLENINDDIDTSADRYIKLWPMMIAGIVTAIMYFLYLLWQSPLVATTLLGISLLQLVPSVIVKKYMQINYNDCREIESKITDRIVEAVEGFEVIKLFGLKSWWQRRMAALHKDYIVIGNRSEATATAQASMRKLLDNILKYGTYAVLGVYAMVGVCHMETAFLAIAISSSFYDAVKQLFTAIPGIGVASISDARIAKWHASQKHTRSDIENGTVMLQSVNFGYGNNAVLNDITYRFEENKTYLIEGENGAGKSTLVKLISGMLFPDNGDVLVGNVTPENFAESMYPHDVLFIPQYDPEFDISAIELFEMIDKRLMAPMLKMAARFNLQMNRMNGCTIRELSGGERKKVFLAIAFVLDPRVLLLDEPTNSIDEQANTILRALLSERTKTTFIISHDPRCHAVADEILNISNGGLSYEAKR